MHRDLLREDLGVLQHISEAVLLQFQGVFAPTTPHRV